MFHLECFTFIHLSLPVWSFRENKFSGSLQNNQQIRRWCLRRKHPIKIPVWFKTKKMNECIKQEMWGLSQKCFKSHCMKPVTTKGSWCSAASTLQLSGAAGKPLPRKFPRGHERHEWAALCSSHHPPADVVRTACGTGPILKISGGGTHCRLPRTIPGPRLPDGN